MLKKQEIIKEVCNKKKLNMLLFYVYFSLNILEKTLLIRLPMKESYAIICSENNN